MFLEVGLHPQAAGGHDGDQIRARLDIGADLRGAVADVTVDRRADLGIAEVELCRLQVGPRLRLRGPCRGDLGIQHPELLASGIERGGRRIDCRSGLLI